MPVKRVNFNIDETAVAEGGSARERLRIEISTDGSITPTMPWLKRPINY
jgi:DNA-directed RNA polymerase subunit alpha